MIRRRVVYLVRHGITEANRRVVYAGRTDDELISDGGSHVRDIARYLSDKQIIEIMASPQRRTFDSAKPLADRLHLRIERCQELAEIEMGPWTGLTDVEIADRFPKEWQTWRESPADVALRDFEGLGEVEKRAGRWLSRLAHLNSPDGAFAAFTHETVIKALLGLASGVGLAVYRGLVVPNASVSSVVFDGSNWKLRSLNEFVSAAEW